MSIKQQIINLLEKISTYDAINVLDNSLSPKSKAIRLKLVNRPLDDLDLEFIKKYENKYNISIPDYDYWRYSSLELSWKKNDEPILYGGFNINGMTELFETKLGGSAFQIELETYEDLYAENLELKDFMWLTKQLATHDAHYGIVHREYGKYPWDIYFLAKGSVFFMNISFEDYFKAMLDSFAIVGWQYFYIEPDELIARTNNQIMENFDYLFGDSEKYSLPNTAPRINGILLCMEICAEWLPKLFPGNDFSYHQQRVSVLRSKLGK